MPAAWGWALVGICFLLALVSLSYRWKVEAGNKAVALALDVQSVRDAAGTMPLPKALATLKQDGLGALVLQEQSVGDLIAQGDLELASPGVLVGAPATFARLAPFLEARFGLRLGPGTTAMRLSALSLSQLSALTAGLDPREAQAAQAAGVVIVARHANRAGTSEALIRALLRSSRELGASVFLPFGDQALGARDLLGFTAETLRVEGFAYASPEFAKIVGDARLAKDLEDRLIRLHSIQAGEVDRTPPAEVVERFARAFRERNQRLLLLRPMSAAQAAPLSSLATTLSAVRRGVEQEGGVLKPPRPYEDPGVPNALILALGAAVGALVVWAGFALFANPWIRGAGTLGVLAAVALSVEPSARVYLATFAAGAFPLAGYLLWRMRPATHPFLAMLSMTFVSLTGGLCVAGLLNALPFLVKTDQFFAVKAAHFLPIVVIAWVLTTDVVQPRVLMAEVVRWGAALLALMVAAALGLMLLRTGNDSPDAVSGVELRLRALLDALLFARPRTKEFLLGHPALLIGLLLHRRAKGGGGWAVLALSLGAIGQTSIVNTLCHLHTPLSQGLARIGTGLAFGLAIGAVAWLILARVLERSRFLGGEV